MKHRARTLVLIIALALGSLLVISRLTKEEPIPVVVAPVERGLVEATVANTRAGTVKACRRARIAPATGGQIARLNVREGDTVKFNQVLLALWNEDLVARLQLEEREAAAAKATAQEICLMSEVTEREAKRLVELRKRNLVAEENVDRAVTGAQAQHARCLAARSRIEVSGARVDVAKAALDRTLLRAPFNGRVAEVNAEVGEFVTPSPPGIATLPAVDIVDTQCLYISAPIDEVDAPAIKPGMETRITLDAFRGQSFDGTIRRVATYVLEREKQARTVDVEAEFVRASDTASLLPGYSADLEVIVDAHDNVIRIPTQAVLEGPRVLVFNRDNDGLLEERPIELGLSNWRVSEILSGLNVGEWIVVSVDRADVKPGVYSKPEQPLPDAVGDQ